MRRRKWNEQVWTARVVQHVQWCWAWKLCISYFQISIYGHHPAHIYVYTPHKQPTYIFFHFYVHSGEFRLKKKEEKNCLDFIYALLIRFDKAQWGAVYTEGAHQRSSMMVWRDPIKFRFEIKSGQGSSRLTLCADEDPPRVSLYYYIILYSLLVSATSPLISNRAEQPLIRSRGNSDNCQMNYIN